VTKVLELLGQLGLRGVLHHGDRVVGLGLVGLGEGDALHGVLGRGDVCDVDEPGVGVAGGDLSESGT